MAILRFQTNISQAVRLRSLEGKQVESQFGGFQHMFTAEEGAFYVSDKVGGILTDQFRKLGVKPGDQVEITKAETGRGPERRTQWLVAVCVPREELQAQGAPVATGVMVVDKLPEPPSALETQLRESIKLVEARKRVAAAASSDPLVANTNQLIDAFAQVVAHASQYPDVRVDDVRSIFLSVYIARTKNGGNSNVA